MAEMHYPSDLTTVYRSGKLPSYVVTSTIETPLSKDRLRRVTANGTQPLHCLIRVNVISLLDSSLATLNHHATRQAFGQDSIGGDDYRFQVVGWVEPLGMAVPYSVPLTGEVIMWFTCVDVSPVLEEESW